MSRIDGFKSGGKRDEVSVFVANPPGRPRTVFGNYRRDAGHNAISRSLVGAVQVRQGNSAASYRYENGRVCKHPDGEKHNCGYVDARNRLIPAAEAFAREIVNGKTFSDASEPPMAFARLFMGEMQRLAKERL